MRDDYDLNDRVAIFLIYSTKYKNKTTLCSQKQVYL